MNMRSAGFRPALCCLLSALLTVLPLPAQDAGPKALSIVIVEGEGAINNLRTRVAREPIVQVEDENHKPVSGALVTFLLPNNGPGATFPNGSKSLTVVTDSNGRAVARGLHANSQRGAYQLRVTAQLNQLTTSATIGMSNAAVAAAAAGAGGAAGLSATTKLLLVLGIVGGAAAAGGTIYAVTNGNGSSTPAKPPVVITPGTPSVGAPR